MARGSCGGRVYILHRGDKGNPWHLYSNRGLRVEPCAKGVRVLSEPVATGYTPELLQAAMLYHL